jgi:hypothetical protein
MFFTEVINVDKDGLSTRFGVMKPNPLSSVHEDIFPFSNVIFWFQLLTLELSCWRWQARVLRMQNA